MAEIGYVDMQGQWVKQPAKTYAAEWQEYDGQYWHFAIGDIQADDTQEAIRLVAANYLSGREIIAIRDFSVREKEEE